MARSSSTTQESAGGEEAGSFPQRWMIGVLVLFLTAIVAAAISGDEVGNVFGTLIYAIFLIPVILPAWMAGILLTAPFAKRGCFQESPWPAGFRSLVALALGLGVMALGTLLLGTIHLLEPGGNVWVAAILPLVAFVAGLVPARNFLRGDGGENSCWTAKAHRGDWLFLLAAVPAGILLIASTFPPGTLWQSEARGYNVMEYHLEMPREYALNNSTAPVAHNMYSYFPANVEMIYLLMQQIAKAVMGGSGDRAAGYLWGTYPAQFFHALLTLLTAAALALMPFGGENRERPWLQATGRAIAVAFFLGTPWTLVTGSLAYNEMGMMFFGTLALGLAFSGRNATDANLPIGPSAQGLLIGLLLGLAVGCKMTAGVFFALPVAAILAWRGMTNGAFLRALAIATGIALLVYAPWAIRAAAYSGGNPLFPVVSSLLPKGEWSTEQAAQFKRGHSPLPEQNTLMARLEALESSSILDGQWSVQPYALLTMLDEQHPVPDESWKRLNLLMLLVPLAVGGALILRPGRREAGYLLAVLVIQLLVWMFTTHLQARFLLPMAVPLALLAGRATQGLHLATEGLWVGVLRIATGVLVGIQTLCVMFLLLPEAGLFGGMERNEKRPPPPIGQLFERVFNVADMVENASSTNPGAKPKALLPPAHLMLLGDATAWRFEGEVTYFTTFDTIPFAHALKTGDAEAAAEWIRSHGIQYIMINWPEVERLRKTYGFEEAITPEAIASLAPFGIHDAHANFGPGILVLRVAN